MRIFKTLPETPENERFFQYYAGLIPTLFKVGFLSQIFSAIIETYILFVILRPKFEGATENPTAAAVVAALLLVALLESGLRVCSTYSARAVLHKRFKGLDLPMTVFIFTLAAALLLCSVTLHIEGAREAVEISTGEAKRETTGHIDTSGRAEIAGLLRSYSQDSATIAGTYAGQIKAGKRADAARVSAYVSSRGATGAGAEQLKAEGAEKIAALEAERGKAFADLLAAKNANLQTVQSRTHAATDDVEQRNKARAEKHESKAAKYSSYLSVFSVLTVVFFLLTIILNEVYGKGAGIERQAVPTQYHFDPSVWSKFTNALSDKWQYHARAAIEVIERSTPAPAAPIKPHPLYQWRDISPERLAATATTRQGAMNAKSAAGSASHTIPAKSPAAYTLSFLEWKETAPGQHFGENGEGYKATVKPKPGKGFEGVLLFTSGGQTRELATIDAGTADAAKQAVEALAVNDWNAATRAHAHTRRNA